MLLQSLSYHISMPSINLRNPLKKKLVFVKEIIQALFFYSTWEHLLCLSSTLRISLPWLVRFGSHYVLDSVFHLGKIISSSIKFSDSNQIESVNN